MARQLENSWLPEDAETAILVGRVWDPETGGPRVVAVHGLRVYDITSVAPTVSGLLESTDPVEVIMSAIDYPHWSLDELRDASLSHENDRAHLLAPVDLQVIKACGVTFVESMVERVIEERCAGDQSRAAEVRQLIASTLGVDLSSLRPGSDDAKRTKEILLASGMWSQYLEVGIGPDPEVFTKAPVMSSVGYGSHVGIPSFSTWNNPEPELVLLVNSSGKVMGATLGNDVNLRDVEGRSALLLGMAKDNNGSCALGPFIRLFDQDFTIESIRNEEITLTVEGEDGYLLEGKNSVGRISRPLEELVNATYGPHHQYPDGFCLFTGTLFAPSQDRDTPGQGFTHKNEDVVSIGSPHLGTLTNTTRPTESLPPWSFGISDLFTYLSKNGNGFGAPSMSTNESVTTR